MTKGNKVEILRYLITDVADGVPPDLEVSGSNKTLINFRSMHIKTQDQ